MEKIFEYGTRKFKFVVELDASKKGHLLKIDEITDSATREKLKYDVVVSEINLIDKIKDFEKLISIKVNESDPLWKITQSLKNIGFDFK